MAKTPKIYTRLTRNAAGLGTYSSLWLAADHFMIVRSTGYNENYARLQLSDLKGIFLTQTGRRMWWAIGWGGVLLWSGIVLIVALANRQTPIFSAVFFATSAVATLWNYLLGPGCRAYVVTGVQTAELPSLVRLNKARRVVAQLQPLIAAAQTAHVTPPATLPPSMPGPPEAAIESAPPAVPPAVG